MLLYTRRQSGLILEIFWSSSGSTHGPAINLDGLSGDHFRRTLQFNLMFGIGAHLATQPSIKQKSYKRFG